MTGSIPLRALSQTLDTDVLRQILTPHPSYEEEEREIFYRQMVYIGALLAQHEMFR